MGTMRLAREEANATLRRVSCAGCQGEAARTANPDRMEHHAPGSACSNRSRTESETSLRLSCEIAPHAAAPHAVSATWQRLEDRGKEACRSTRGGD